VGAGAVPITGARGTPLPNTAHQLRGRTVSSTELREASRRDQHPSPIAPGARREFELLVTNVDVIDMDSGGLEGLLLRLEILPGAFHQLEGRRGQLTDLTAEICGVLDPGACPVLPPLVHFEAHAVETRRLENGVRAGPGWGKARRIAVGGDLGPQAVDHWRPLPVHAAPKAGLEGQHSTDGGAFTVHEVRPLGARGAGARPLGQKRGDQHDEDDEGREGHQLETITVCGVGGLLPALQRIHRCRRLAARFRKKETPPFFS